MVILDRLFPPHLCDPVAGDRWAAGYARALTGYGMHTHRVDAGYEAAARAAFAMDMEGEG